MNYNIVATGSKAGNCTIIENEIAIDMGVPYKKIEPYAKDLTLVLLTHVHSDHFNKSTVKRLHAERPSVRFGCGNWMLPLLEEIGISKRVIDVFNGKSGKRYNRKFTIFCEPLPHNVPNCGYKIIYGRERLFYATDTSSLTNVEAPNFDIYLIEGNYSKDEIKERIRQKKATGEYAYEIDAEYNHLSKEDALEWLAKNAGSHSKYVFMHEHVE